MCDSICAIYSPRFISPFKIQYMSNWDITSNGQSKIKLQKYFMIKRRKQFHEYLELVNIHVWDVWHRGALKYENMINCCSRIHHPTSIRICPEKRCLLGSRNDKKKSIPPVQICKNQNSGVKVL